VEARRKSAPSPIVASHLVDARVVKDAQVGESRGGGSSVQLALFVQSLCSARAIRGKVVQVQATQYSCLLLLAGTGTTPSDV
jgi:hypothetical protein